MRFQGCTMILAIILAAFSGAQADLEQGFYGSSCPQAERFIFHFVSEHISYAPSLAASLLRMHFHDCFVRGCDASILINSTSTNEAEKDAIPNRTLRGFDFIDRLKRLIEEQCPGIVSCADILALAARDAIAATGGPFWRVATGRRDGLVSKSSEALSQIPSPKFNFTSLRASFASKGLDVTDLVILSGAHTIGVAHCEDFSDRLYNFTGQLDQDPSLDSLYAANLKQNKCRSSSDNATIVEMDPGSFRTFDLGYYRNLLKRRGLFQSDAALMTDEAVAAAIASLVDGPLDTFFSLFALSMEKLGTIEVITAASAGEIRKNCALVNNS